jgi:hypothetical protein
MDTPTQQAYLAAAKSNGVTPGLDRAFSPGYFTGLFHRAF